MIEHPKTIEQLLSICTPHSLAIAQAARKKIMAVVPFACERLRSGWRLIGYNAPAYFTFVAPEAHRVRIGFEWGVMLDDPTRLLEGDGKQVRYVSLPDQQALENPALADLLRAAATFKAHK
jgi:hypothetical protein